MSEIQFMRLKRPSGDEITATVDSGYFIKDTQGRVLWVGPDGEGHVIEEAGVFDRGRVLPAFTKLFAKD